MSCLKAKIGLACLGFWAVTSGCPTASASVVRVDAPQTDACKKVTVAGKASVDRPVGTKVALAVTANAGWSFAGWYADYDAGTGVFTNKVAFADAADWRTASPKYVVGEEDATLYARFVQPQDDGLWFDFSDALDVDGKLSPTNAVDIWLNDYMESESLPTLSFSGLPSGLSFDRTAQKITGTPTKTGVYVVKATGRNVSGYAYSQTLTVTVGNLVSDHVTGCDDDSCTVGDKIEEGSLRVTELFEIDDSELGVKAISLAGLPAGLRLKSDADKQDGSIYGTPTQAGTFVVTATVTFTNGIPAKATTEKATALMAVAPVDPTEYGVDFLGVEGKCVGDVLTLEDEVRIGSYDLSDKTGITSVSGLPKGVSAVKVEGDGEIAYYAVGTFSEAGRFTCRASVVYENDGGVRNTVQLSQSIDVLASEGVYLTAAATYPDGEQYEKATGCKVTGSGVYVPGTLARLSPTAASGYVFAGWYDDSLNPMAVAGADCRRSPLSYAVTAEDDGKVIYADFMLKADDAVDVSELDGGDFHLDPADEAGFGTSFAVESGSLPTLTFRNLPTGMTCLPDDVDAGCYVLGYDPATAKAAPKPGRYQVVATAKNVSGKSDTANFLVTVCNLTNAVIDIKDDYGILTPNAEMTWIDFSRAVDTNLYTLAVAGNPTGTKFYTTYDRQKKIPAYVLAGVPTVPGYYTMTFTATDRKKRSDKHTATAFITVKPFPEIAVEITEAAAAAGCKVAGTGNYRKGTKVTLRATAAKGWVFTGWSGLDGVEGLAALNPSVTYTMTTNDLTEATATFAEIRDDRLYVGDIYELGDESVSNTAVFARNVPVATNLIERLIDTASYPTVNVTGLPSGLAFNAKTFLITGKIARTAKVGATYATVTAKNAGGYAFTRILRCAVVAAEGDQIPADAALKNDACIDFAGIEGLCTGDWCDEGAGVGFIVGAETNSESDVAAVRVTGLPTGLSAKTTLDADSGEAVVCALGTPTRAGRYTVRVDVTYADGKTRKSEHAVIVQDGGSVWLDVLVPDELTGLGTVTGSGVYSSGARIALRAAAAKDQVFGGWYEDDACSFAFENLAMMDGIDYRTASATFVFRPDMFCFPDAPVLYAAFDAKANDVAPCVEFGAEDVWTIDPAMDDSVDIRADSFSQPKVTVTGLPRGVTLDPVRGRIAYDSAQAALVVPGWYTVTVKAVNQSGKSATATLKVFVANRESEWIEGLDPAADAYSLMVGVAANTNGIAPVVTNALTLSCAGLPSGLSLKRTTDPKTRKVTGYYVSGVPTRACTNTVTFTATGRMDGKQLREVATVTVCVEPLPVWSQGNFNGVYRQVVETAAGIVTSDVGTVSLTVGAAGAVSGKILAGGKSFPIRAASLSAFDDAGTSAEIAVAWTAKSNETLVVDFEAGASGLGVAYVCGLGGCGAELVQNLWERKDLNAPGFATGTSQPVLKVDDLTCRFGDKGKVVLSGKIDGVSASGTTQTLAGCSDMAKGANARIAVYVADARFENGAYCAVYDVLLTDEDGDGKYDKVETIRPTSIDVE